MHTMIDKQSKPSSENRLATEPSRKSKEIRSSDIVAARHIKLVVDAITSDNTLTHQERKEKLANFGAALMAAASTAKISSPQQLKKTTNNGTPVGVKHIPEIEIIASTSTSSLSSDKQLSGAMLVALKASCALDDNKHHELAPTANTLSPSIPSPLQLKPMAKKTKKKKKDWIFGRNRNKNHSIEVTTDKCDEVREDIDEKDVTERNSERDTPNSGKIQVEAREPEVSSPHINDAVIMDARRDQSDEHDASVCSDRSIGTFEQDFINNIVQDQMEDDDLGDIQNVLSEATFEQDAREIQNVLSEATFEQDAREIEAEHEIDLHMKLSEATFEQDAREVELHQTTGRGATAIVVPQNAINGYFIDTNLSETTFEQDARGTEQGVRDVWYGSETTFERDARKKVATTQIIQAPCYSLAEKDARAREALAAMMPPPQILMDSVSNDVSEDCTIDCSAKTSKERPDRQVENQTVKAAVPLQLPISWLQMVLSPGDTTKSPKKSFFSRGLPKCSFTCEFAP